jgi:hypothetical protein
VLRESVYHRFQYLRGLPRGNTGAPPRSDQAMFVICFEKRA